MKVYDKKGIPIEVGDVLKVFHYVARERKEKIYMYKQVIGRMNVEIPIVGQRYIISHLDNNTIPYTLIIDGHVWNTYEIVQSSGTYYKDRERIKI